MVLGEKFGPSLLPTAIPQAEFEAVTSLARAFRERRRAEIGVQILEVQARWADRVKPEDGGNGGVTGQSYIYGGVTSKSYIDGGVTGQSYSQLLF